MRNSIKNRLQKGHASIKPAWLTAAITGVLILSSGCSTSNISKYKPSASKLKNAGAVVAGGLAGSEVAALLEKKHIIKGTENDARKVGAAVGAVTAVALLALKKSHDKRTAYAKSVEANGLEPTDEETQNLEEYTASLNTAVDSYEKEIEEVAALPANHVEKKETSLELIRKIEQEQANNAILLHSIDDFNSRHNGFVSGRRRAQLYSSYQPQVNAQQNRIAYQQARLAAQRESRAFNSSVSGNFGAVTGGQW